VTVEDYKGKHSGEECWLFAKGVGLDLFDFNDAGPFRVTINHACHVVPNPTYCCSWHKEDHTRPNCKFFGREGVTVTDIIEDSDIPNGLFFKKHSSTEIGMSYAIYLGASIINIVGVNPDHAYSDNFKIPTQRLKKYLRFERSEATFKNDARIRRNTLNNCLKLAEHYGVEVIEHQVDLPENTLYEQVMRDQSRVPATLVKQYVKRYQKKSKASA
jgi:hypothetical protein